MQVDDETSCMLINDDLQVSRSAILCNQCQFQSMCFHSELGDSGVCACGTRQRQFQTCSPQDAQTQNSLSLMLNNLCIVSPASSQFYEIEFAQTSVIACMQLDPTTASCAYVVDSNMFIVRGHSRSGRRLLSSTDATYSSLDSSCRDALVSENLPFTRAVCQANFENSLTTLQLLGLERQLPPCAFCSLTVCLELCSDSNRLCLPRYPSAKCTKSCRDSPFAYTSASSVAAWVIAEIGQGATNYALNQSKLVPLLDYQHFNQELLSHTVTLKRGSEEFLRAHRLCAGLSSYMLFPYLLLVLLAVGLISTMLTLLASQIYPVLVLVFSLFTAASAGSKNTFYKTETFEQNKHENYPEEENIVETETRSQHVVNIP